MRNVLKVLAFLAVLIAYREVSAANLYVGSGGVPLYTTIQAAINASANGDYILVAPGTYNESINFLGKMVYVKGTAGPAQTTISGAGLGQSVVNAISGEIEKTVLDGFTVTAGTGLAGGINCGGSRPTFINLRVVNNAGVNVGGVAFYNCTSLIKNTIIAGNTATYQAAGVQVEGGHPVLQNVVIQGNRSTIGAAIRMAHGAVDVTSSTISGNFSNDGAIYVGSNSSLWMYNSIVWDNITSTDPGHNFAFNC